MRRVGLDPDRPIGPRRHLPRDRRPRPGDRSFRHPPGRRDGAGPSLTGRVEPDLSWMDDDYVPPPIRPMPPVIVMRDDAPGGPPNGALASGREHADRHRGHPGGRGADRRARAAHPDPAQPRPDRAPRRAGDAQAGTAAAHRLVQAARGGAQAAVADRRRAGRRGRRGQRRQPRHRARRRRRPLGIKATVVMPESAPARSVPRSAPPARRAAHPGHGRGVRAARRAGRRRARRSCTPSTIRW